MMPGENLLKHMFPYKCKLFNIDAFYIIKIGMHYTKLFPFVIRYKQAGFCYEELILAHPTIPLYHIAYAEVI
jgi:hypothetical protein